MFTKTKNIYLKDKIKRNIFAILSNSARRQLRSDWLKSSGQAATLRTKTYVTAINIKIRKGCNNRLLRAVIILIRFIIIKCSSSGGGFCNFLKTLRMIVFYVSWNGISNFCPLITK